MKRLLAAWLVVVALVSAVPGAVSSVAAYAAAPSFVHVRQAYLVSDLRLLDRHGVVLQEKRVDPTRRRFPWVELSELSPALVEAVIRTEDKRFYEHSGADFRALAAAGVDWLLGRSRRGASTITMQLAGLLDPTLRAAHGHRSWQQKRKQLWAAWQLERTWSKSEILEAYLNLTSFRGEIQGIGAASQLLFGKQPHGLTVAESQALAALLKGPNVGRELLLQRASRAGQATTEEVTRAVDRVTSRHELGAPVDEAPHLAERLLRSRRQSVLSTIDASVQAVAIDSLRQNLLALRDRHVADGAVLVADNASGEVLAYVGGVPDVSSAVHVDAIKARRQAGSTLKPFLYATALEQRLLTASSLLEDVPLEIGVAGGLYRPRDYDGIYRGLVSVRRALAGSLNVPAVRTLLLVGDDGFAGRLRQLGFSGVREAGDYYGPSLALGSADVTLWELVNAYRTLANGGDWSELSVESMPTVLNGGNRVLSPEATFVVADILADRESRAETFGVEGPLSTRYWSAVKTGTSKEMRDNWCVGFSRCFTVGVWVGNLDGEPMHDVSGIAGAAPVWREVMDRLNVACAGTAPTPPRGVRRAEAMEPSRRGEWYLAGTEPAPLRDKSSIARITSPVSGTVLAIDPDIPSANQRMIFEASGARHQLRWQIDQTDLGGAGESVLWQPEPGPHTLALVDPTGMIADHVEFVVRGRM